MGSCSAPSGFAFMSLPGECCDQSRRLHQDAPAGHRRRAQTQCHVSLSCAFIQSWTSLLAPSAQTLKAAQLCSLCAGQCMCAVLPCNDAPHHVAVLVFPHNPSVRLLLTTILPCHVGLCSYRAITHSTAGSTAAPAGSTAAVPRHRLLWLGPAATLG
jgi:hypothetical protein